MTRSLVSLLPVLLTLGPAGCKKSSDGGGEQSSAEQTAQVGKICESMNDLSLAYVAGVMEIEVDDLDAPGKRAELLEACKTLPVAVARCADRLAIDDAKCDAALEEFLGMTDSKPQGQGPAPTWELTPSFEVFDFELGPDGRVAIAGDSDLAMVEGGELRWSVQLDGGSGWVSWWKDHVVTGVKNTVRAYDTSGKEAWSATVGDEDSVVRGVEPGPGDQTTLITAGGEIVRIDGDACASGSEGCATTVATVESMSNMVFEVLGSGAVLGSSDERIVLVSAQGEVLAERPADYDAGLPRDGLVVQGKDVLRADPSCDEGSDACLQVLTSAKDLELVAPLRLDGALVYADTYGVIVSTGAHEWKIDAGNDSDLLSDGTTIFSVGHPLGLDSMDAPPQVRAIDPAAGKTKWITPLGSERASLLSGPVVELGDEQLVVMTKTQLFAVPVGK